jgi:uncharacterized protein with GYD domain
VVASTFCVLVIALIFYVYILLINLILNIMATTQTIDATIFASTHPDIAKRTSVSGVLISSVMLLIGILAFASIFELDDKSSTASMALMVLGTGLFLMGIFRLFWKSKEVIYLPTKSVAKEHSVFFDLKHVDTLMNFVNSGSFSTDLKIKSEASGNIRMDVMLSADKKFAAVQLFQFVPYTYQPITPVQYFTNEEASAVVAFLSKSKI